MRFVESDKLISFVGPMRTIRFRDITTAMLGFSTPLYDIDQGCVYKRNIGRTGN